MISPGDHSQLKTKHTVRRGLLAEPAVRVALDDLGGPYDVTALHLTATQGHEDLARALLRAGADRAARNKFGHTFEQLVRAAGSAMPADSSRRLLREAR